LPLALKTAFAWLRRLPEAFDGSRGAVPAEAWDAARAAYEGAVRAPGERETNAYLRRAFPDFDALAAHDEFITLATSLLLPVQRAPLAGSRARRGSDTGDDSDKKAKAPAGETA
jgi:exodeoxyribonuclease V gamma subunit